MNVIAIPLFGNVGDGLGPSLEPQVNIIEGPSEMQFYDDYFQTYVPYIYFCISVEDDQPVCDLENKCSLPFGEWYNIYALKQSKTDPSCWCSTFEWHRYAPFYRTVIGNCQFDVIDRHTGWHMCQCEGRNGYDIEFYVGPVNSGNYRILIEAEQWPDWECGSDYESWGQPVWEMSDEKKVTVKGDALDIILFSNLYYLDQSTGDESYDGQYINPFTPYRIVTKVFTTRNNEADMPGILTGHLHPNGGYDRNIRFNRYPQLDEEPPCHMWDHCYYTYAYISDSDIVPKDLWLYSDEQWNDLKTDMTINLKGTENQVKNDIEAKVWVQYLLHIDCQNDTSVCFVPASDEKMDFLLSYSKYLDIGPDTDIKFLIENKNEQVVYSEQLTMPPYEQDGPAYLEMPLKWKGRCNSGARTGHLADPDLSPYKAYVSLEQGEGMKSNFEYFGVSPKIDSILITHHIWYPPPGPVIYRDVNLFSVIKGKIDDRNPDEDYRFYLYGTTHLDPDNDHFWDGEKYKFSDGSQQTEYNFFEDLKATQFKDIPRRQWLTEQWGQLEYQWWVIHDRRLGTSGMEIDYSVKHDTTDWWHDNWQVRVEAPYDEDDRKRLLVYNQIYQTSFGYDVQACTSAVDEDAHKVIFGPIEGHEGRDNIYWSSTHIGVPYGYGAKVGYKHIDCSGFCIATQIQGNNGALHSGNHIIRLGCANATKLVEDQLSVNCLEYADHDNSNHIHTTVEISDAAAQRGDMIGLNGQSSTPPPWGHIANISYAVYDFGHDKFADLLIYEAKGNTTETNPGPLNLVRHEDAIVFYINRNYHKKCVRWDY